MQYKSAGCYVIDPLSAISFENVLDIKRLAVQSLLAASVCRGSVVNEMQD